MRPQRAASKFVHRSVECKVRSKISTQRNGTVDEMKPAGLGEQNIVTRTDPGCRSAQEPSREIVTRAKRVIAAACADMKCSGEIRAAILTEISLPSAQTRGI